MLKKEVSENFNGNSVPPVRWLWDGSDMPEGSGAMLTGPVSGEIVLKDGTRYDVTPDVIEYGPGHAGPITHHIERLLEASGDLAKIRSDASHVCTEACGAEAS